MRDRAPPLPPRDTDEPRREPGGPGNGADGAVAAPPAAKAAEPAPPATAAVEADTDAAAARDAAPAPADVDQRSGEEPAHPGIPLSPPGIVPESDVRVHSPSAAQPHHHQQPWAEDLGDLPWGYGDGRLVTLLRDPRTVFVYWDLSQQQIEQAFHGLG